MVTAKIENLLNEKYLCQPTEYLLQKVDLVQLNYWILWNQILDLKAPFRPLVLKIAIQGKLISGKLKFN